MSTPAQQTERLVDIEQARGEVTRAIAHLLNVDETTKAEAFRALPVCIEKWGAVIRANKHILDELREVADAAHVQIPFGYGLLPDLSNPVIGTTQIKI